MGQRSSYLLTIGYFSATCKVFSQYENRDTTTAYSLAHSVDGIWVLLLVRLGIVQFVVSESLDGLLGNIQ